MPTDTPPAELEVRADALAHGGEAVCRTADGVVFVPGLLPGETARVAVTYRKKRFARAMPVALLDAAAHRLAPACPAAAAGAGCCDLSVTDTATAASLKAQVARDQFVRLGGLSASLVDDLRLEQLQTPDESGLPGGTETDAQAGMRGWRTVARRHMGADGRLGVFAAGSHEVIGSAPCTQVVDALAAAFERIELADVLPPGAELVARAGRDGQVCAAWREPEPPAPRGRSPRTRGDRRSAAQRRRAAAARRPHWQALPAELGIPDTGPATDGRFSWDLPATAFWQPHRGAVECYQRHVAAALADLPHSGAGDRRLGVWDLYAGVGALSWTPLSRLADRGIAIELHQVETAPEACAAAADAAGALPESIDSHIHHRPVSGWLAARGRTTDAPDVPDLVIADPPRAGLEPDVIGRLAALRPPALVHIGCDIAAAARDVGALVRSGYTLREVTVVDAFPGTHHAEVVTRLSYPA